MIVTIKFDFSDQVKLVQKLGFTKVATNIICDFGGYFYSIDLVGAFTLAVAAAAAVTAAVTAATAVTAAAITFALALALSAIFLFRRGRRWV